MKRYSVNKGTAAKKFARQVGRTKAPNVQTTPMRGGWRL